MKVLIIEDEKLIADSLNEKKKRPGLDPHSDSHSENHIPRHVFRTMALILLDCLFQIEVFSDSD